MKRFTRRVRGRRLVTSRKKISWVMAPEKTYTREFGQQHTVPNFVDGLESCYITPEATDTTVESEDEVLTRPLGNIHDIMKLTSYAFSSVPNFAGINVSPATTGDFYQGHLWWRGTDVYTIRNQTDEPVRMVAYICHPRHNHREELAAPYNLYKMLGRGFQERGYDTNNGTATNKAMFQPAITPFDSSIFVRNFKITRKFGFKIPTAGMKRVTLRTRWRSVQPISLVWNAGNTNTGWEAQTKRYDYIRGEKIIIFKLFGNPAAVTGQISFTKNIGQTEPGIIMHTARKYQYKHLPIMSVSNIVTEAPAGVVSTAGVIMRDEDWKAGASAVAD